MLFKKKKRKQSFAKFELRSFALYIEKMGESYFNFPVPSLEDPCGIGKQMKAHKHWGTSYQLPLTFHNAKYLLQTLAQSKREHESCWISAEPS